MALRCHRLHSFKLVNSDWEVISAQTQSKEINSDGKSQQRWKTIRRIVLKTAEKSKGRTPCTTHALPTGANADQGHWTLDRQANSSPVRKWLTHRLTTCASAATARTKVSGAFAIQSQRLSERPAGATPHSRVRQQQAPVGRPTLWLPPSSGGWWSVRGTPRFTSVNGMMIRRT